MSRPMVTLTVAEAEQLLDGLTAVESQLAFLFEMRPAMVELRDAMEELHGWIGLFESIKEECTD